MEGYKRLRNCFQKRDRKIVCWNVWTTPYDMGDYVFLKIQPYRFRSLASRPNNKFCPHLYDQYER